MIDTSLVIAFVAIITIKLIYNQYIESTRDVSEIYLTQQSIIDGTRLPGESAIYKSNKLDYTNGLRVGLHIRYDHYKLRNGNLCDVWEIFVKGTKQEPEKCLTIDGVAYQVSELNYKIQNFGQHLVGRSVERVAMRFDRFLRDGDVFVIVMACFVNQIGVNFYDQLANADRSALFVVGEEEVDAAKECGVNFVKFGDEENELWKVIRQEGKEYDFTNDYHFSKDKGTSVIVSRAENSKVTTSVDFSQINLVSSIASTLKHLPKSHEITEKDRIIIIEDFNNNEEFLNALVKLLVGMVSRSEIIWTRVKSWDEISALDPTIVSLSENSLTKLLPLSTLKEKSNPLEKLFYRQKTNLLSKGKFSKGYSQSALRLIYTNKSITTEMNLNTYEINEYRAFLNSRIVLEFSNYNVLGPIIHTDFYDYRVLPSLKLNAYGCVSQSLEIKLTNYNEGSGNVTIRGFVIGKTTKAISGIGDTQQTPSSNATKENKGFMSLPITGRWGNDGCLYI